MTDVIDALVAVIQSGKQHRKPDAEWLARADTASGDARKLLLALATHRPPSWTLGKRFMIGGVATFAYYQRRHNNAELPFDVEHSCELGNAYNAKGDGPTWGFRWAGNTFELIEIIDGNVVTYTPKAWFENLRKDELALWAGHGHEPPSDLVDFLAACGKPYVRNAKTPASKAEAPAAKAKATTTKVKTKTAAKAKTPAAKAKTSATKGKTDAKSKASANR